MLLVSRRKDISNVYLSFVKRSTSLPGKELPKSMARNNTV